MNVIFSVTKLQYETLGGHTYKQLVFDGTDSGLPPENHALASLKDIEATFATYAEKAKATGKSLQVSIRQNSRCKARKLAGFDKLSRSITAEVNPAFEDGTPYVEAVAA